MICKFCLKECKNDNSLRNHQRLCKANPNRQASPFESKEVQHSRKKSNAAIKAKESGIEFTTSLATRANIGAKSKAHWTDEKREAWSIRMKLQSQKNIENHPESYSYKNFCGRAKKSLYKDEWMHSSWELEVAKWFDANNIKWTKQVRYFYYEWNGSTHRYFPDFYLQDLDLYVEVKGYETDRDIQKWKSIRNLIVLKDKEIKSIKCNTFSLGQVS
jgi:hypothetical protein